MEPRSLTNAQAHPEAPAGPAYAARHLEYLYEISKRLTGFEGLARTFPELMTLASRVLPLRSVLLLEGVDVDGNLALERPRLTAWRVAEVTAPQLSVTADRAAATYAYLVGTKEVEPQGELDLGLVGTGAWVLPEPPTEAGPAFVTLPLVAKGRVFGTLHVEGAEALTEEGLAFLDAVANLLATALDRFHALQREVGLRERAEVLEQAHRALLERERQQRLEAETAHQRQAFLAEASALLAASLDYRASMPSLARLLVPRWADCCAIDVLHPKGLGGERVAMMAAEPPGRAGRESFVAQALASHPWMAFPAGPENLPEAHVSRESLEWTGFPSNLRLPIRVRGRTLGVLSLISAQPGRYDAADAALFGLLAQRIAAAVDAALLYQQAQEAVRWREELLAVVSHDIKTPLLVVRMNAEMLLKAAKPPGAERRRHGRRHLDSILLAVDQMRDLIGNILDRARLEGMPMPLTLQPQEAGALLEQTVAVLRPLAQVKRQVLEVELCPGLPRVRADRERVLQVLANLVGNAIKFTPMAGTITLRARRVDGQVRFSVKDSGPGIRSEDVPHLFERFWRAAGASERGTGLGLSIVKRIVEAHGGTVWVETREGAGSTFFFTLPVDEG